jgi:glycerophosphoryl diester phosphodiesterase
MQHANIQQRLLLGHRGSPHVAAENTMASFHAAIAAGAAGFEFDVRKSKDGKLVVIHDSRTRRPRKSVARNTAAQLGLPLLEDVLRTFRGAWLDIEMKVPGIERQVIELAHRYLQPERFVITSFRARSIREVKRVSPATPAGWLFKRPRLFLPRWTKRIDFICPHHKVLTRRLARLARERGLRVATWTVNSPRDYKRVAGLADVIISDFPDRYAKAGK